MLKMLAADLDNWLNARPTIANSIVWEAQPPIGPVAWPLWSEPTKAKLRRAFELAWTQTVFTVPPNQKVLLDDRDLPITILAAGDAGEYFMASVAQSLVAEILLQLPWSIEDYTAPQLSQLFDSREMFNWHLSPAGYLITDSHGSLVPGPPAGGYAFLVDHHLIGETRLETIERVLFWCRRLAHAEAVTVGKMEEECQYRGYPPMTRVLDGTVPASGPFQGRKWHFTAGCWGTVGLLRALLRLVNIPVKLLRTVSNKRADLLDSPDESPHKEHAQAWFMADARYLPHGDDAFGGLSVSDIPPVPAGELLIDQAQFDAWFAPAVDETEKFYNLGRRGCELFISYLPIRLLQVYCLDLAGGKDHAAGDVFTRTFALSNYMVAELEARHLWDLMDAKLTTLGGIQNVLALPHDWPD